jgi:hypothetical protein
VEVDHLDYYPVLGLVGVDYPVAVLFQEAGAVHHPAGVEHLLEELLQDLVLQAHHYILYS